MGHHSKKKNQGSPQQAPAQPNMNNLGQLFNNIDINSMSSMLNNIDINQVMSMLSKGFVPPTTAPPPSNDSSSTAKSDGSDTIKNPNMNIFNSIPTPPQGDFNPVLPTNDPAVMVLNSLKPFLPPDKCMIIDNMIQLLGIKTVIDKIFPPSAQAKNNEKPKSNIEESKVDNGNTNEDNNIK